MLISIERLNFNERDLVPQNTILEWHKHLVVDILLASHVSVAHISKVHLLYNISVNIFKPATISVPDLGFVFLRIQLDPDQGLVEHRGVMDDYDELMMAPPVFIALVLVDCTVLDPFVN